MTDRVAVSYNTLIAAHRHVQLFAHGRKNFNPTDFWNSLKIDASNVTPTASEPWGGWSVNENVANIVTMLAGPHWRTVIRVLEINNDLEAGF